MLVKILETRIQNKIDTADNWNSKPDFVPLKGEAIIYDVDSEHDATRIKFGDGVTTVVNLPFASTPGEPQEKIAVTIPTQKNVLTYNGTYQQPEWENYDANIMLMSEQTSAIDANEEGYTTIFTLKDTTKYYWKNNIGATYVTVKWKIYKASASFLIEPSTEINISSDNNEATISVYYLEEAGNPTAEYDTEYMNVTQSNPSSVNKDSYNAVTNFTITMKDDAPYEDYSIIFSSIASTNYKSATATASIHYYEETSQKTLEDFTWEELKDIATDGDISTLKDYVGDTKKVSNFSLYNYPTTLNVRLVHVDEDNKKLFFQGFVENGENKFYQTSVYDSAEDNQYAPWPNCDIHGLCIDFQEAIKKAINIELSMLDNSSEDATVALLSKDNFDNFDYYTSGNSKAYPGHYWLKDARLENYSSGENVPKMYVWQKYGVKYDEPDWGMPSSTTYQTGTFSGYSDYELNTTTGTYSVSGSATYSSSNGPWYGNIYSISSDGKALYRTSFEGIDTNIPPRLKVSNYSKGVTETYDSEQYVGPVTSTNQSEYPINGKHTDGYFYIRTTIENVLSVKYVDLDDEVKTSYNCTDNKGFVPIFAIGK